MPSTHRILPGFPLALVFVGLTLALGCATASETAGSEDSSDDITATELETSTAEDVMEAVALLRPRWLRARPSRTPGAPAPRVGVVIDGRPRGTLEDLAQLRTATVERISFLSAGDATIRWGTGFTGGAIIVVTKR